VLYRNFATQEELDAQYDLEGTVPEVSLYEDFYAQESEKVRAELNHRLGVPFGPTLAEHLDLYPAPGTEHAAPVLVYLHGGYWRSRTSKEFGFVARGPASHGVATAVVNYALCPVVSIDEIVRQTRAALAWTFKSAASFGGDSERIHVAGHSAGISRRCFSRQTGKVTTVYRRTLSKVPPPSAASSTWRHSPTLFYNPNYS